MTSALRMMPLMAIFPGYFVYHWSALNGITPLFIGGYINEISFAITSGVIFSFFVKLFILKREPLHLTSVDHIFIIYIVWYASIVITQSFFMKTPVVIKNHTASLVQTVAVFLALRIYPYEKTNKVLLALTAAFSFSVLAAPTEEILTIFLRAVGIEGSATYQGLARAYLVTASLGILCISSRAVRIASYPILLFVLFLLGARSEILGAVIALSIFEILMSKRPLQSAIFVASIIFATIAVLFAASDWISEQYPDNRLMKLVASDVGDSSVEERSIQLSIAWRAVLDSPFLGDFGHYERELSAGAYAHNLLSVWVDLGIAGLLLFILIYCFSTYAILNISKAEKKTSSRNLKLHYSLALSLLLMMIVFSIFAKAFTDTGTAMVAGMCSGLLAMCTKNTRSQPIEADIAYIAPERATALSPKR
jgi:hypothetical protein